MPAPLVKSSPLPVPVPLPLPASGCRHRHRQRQKHGEPLDGAGTGTVLRSVPSFPMSFDRVANCYDATREMPPHAKVAATAGIIGALRAVAPQPTLIEVGIGTGRMAVPLAEAGVRVAGVDVAVAMLARLRAKRPDIAVAIANATHLPFSEGTFDGALLVHILHLLPDAVAALRAATDVVRPGGILLYGRTNYAESPRRQLIARAREVAQELAGIDLGSGDWHRAANHAFAEHARDIGARVSESTLARWRERGTGREYLAALSGRVYSSTWSIPEAVMPELLRRLTPWAEAFLGDLDRPIETEGTFALLSAHLPK